MTSLLSDNLTMLPVDLGQVLMRILLVLVLVLVNDEPSSCKL